MKKLFLNGTPEQNRNFLICSGILGSLFACAGLILMAHFGGISTLGKAASSMLINTPTPTIVLTDTPTPTKTPFPTSTPVLTYTPLPQGN